MKKHDPAIRRTALALIPISIALSGCPPKTESAYPSGCPPGISSEWRCNENGVIRGWVGRAGDPLKDAISAGDFLEAERLVEAGEDANQGLINASAYGQSRIARMLIDRGADVNYANNIKWTPLMSAVASGQKGMVELLIEKGADVNARHDYGGTPLSIAKEKGFADIADYLKRNGAR